MTELDYIKLQSDYGGQFVAHCRGQVLASASTYEALQHRLGTLAVPDEEIVVEYIEHPDRAYVY